MIALKENNRVYFAESAAEYNRYDLTDDAYLPENMSIFKAAKSKILVGGDSPADLDIVRYFPRLFPAELSFSSLNDKVVPKLYAVLSLLGRLDEDGEMKQMFFAKGNKAFMLTGAFGVKELEKTESSDWWEDFFRYALAATEGLPLTARIRKVYQTVGKIVNKQLFPVVMMDSVSFKLQIIKEELS